MDWWPAQVSAVRQSGHTVEVKYEDDGGTRLTMRWPEDDAYLLREADIEYDSDISDESDSDDESSESSSTSSSEENNSEDSINILNSDFRIDNSDFLLISHIMIKN
mgnify:CR=1 FL=1